MRLAPHKFVAALALDATNGKAADGRESVRLGHGRTAFMGHYVGRHDSGRIGSTGRAASGAGSRLQPLHRQQEGLTPPARTGRRAASVPAARDKYYAPP